MKATFGLKVINVIHILFVMILIMFICKIMTTIMRLTIPAPHVGVEEGEGDKECSSMAHHLSW